jgi:translation initiation factor 4E
MTSEIQQTSTTTEQEQEEQQITTVPTNVTPDRVIKHPLESKWVIWFDPPLQKYKTEVQWRLSLRRLIDFDTVEDFWCVWHHIAAPSKLPLGTNYHLFKMGIEPSWEDPANEKGGEWNITMKKSQQQPALDELWISTILAMIGEQFGNECDKINGAVVSPRPNLDRVVMWTKQCNETEKKSIGMTLKSFVLPPTSEVKLQHFAHGARNPDLVLQNPRNNSNITSTTSTR